MVQLIIIGYGIQCWKLSHFGSFYFHYSHAIREQNSESDINKQLNLLTQWNY